MAGKKRRHPKVRAYPKGERVDEDGNRYWILRWMQDGKRRSEAVGFASETEATEAAADKQAALRLGVQLTSGTSEGWNVADVVLAYAREVGKESRHGQLETRRTDHLARLVGWVQVDRLTTAHLRQYMLERSTEPGKRKGSTAARATIMGEVKALLRAWRFCRDAGLIDAPAPSLPPTKTLPDDKRPHRRVTEDEVAAFLAAAHRDHLPGLGTLLQVFAWSGRRPIAITSLRRRDCEQVIDGTERARVKVYWHRDKGGESRGWGPHRARLPSHPRPARGHRGRAGRPALAPTQRQAVHPGRPAPARAPLLRGRWGRPPHDLRPAQVRLHAHLPSDRQHPGHHAVQRPPGPADAAEPLHLRRAERGRVHRASDRLDAGRSHGHRGRPPR